MMQSMDTKIHQAESFLRYWHHKSTIPMEAEWVCWCEMRDYTEREECDIWTLVQYLKDSDAWRPAA